MRTSLKVGIVAAFAFVASATGAQAALNLPTMQCSYSFPSDMGLGARSTSVMDLQKVLNMYPETRVAVTGAGSAGMETTYFGPATRAAVKKFQAINNVLTTGFVGPLTRATLNMVCTGSTGGVSGLPAGCSSTSGFSPITGQSCGSGTGTVVSGSGLTVTAGTNTGGTLIAGAAQVPVLNFRVMNGSAGEVTVNSLKFMKLGTVSDASITNGYLSSGNQIVGQYTSLAQGVMTFNGVNAKIPAGASVDMSLRIDLASGQSIAAGNLIGFQLMSANDVVISAGTVGGSFPLVGGNFYTTTVTNPALASISNPVYQGVGSQVDAGSMSFRAGAVSFQVVNNPVKIQSVRFNVNGSINPSQDLANAKLRINGAEVSTGVVNGNSLFFDLGSNPKLVSTGSQLMEVYVDVLGTPNRSFRLEILRPYDVVLMDTQYNTNISFTTPSGSATLVDVRKGTATVSLASDTPTGTIPLGGSNVTLAKFRVYAAGEALRIKYLPFSLTKTGGSDWAVAANLDANIRNIALYGDDGVQVGTTINVPSSCAFGVSLATNVYSCGFGSSSANINYTIPANTNRVLSLKADVQTGATFSTVLAALEAGTSNVEGQISFQTSSLPGGRITASTLSLSTTPFQVALNSSLSGQTIVGGANMQRIGSFQLSASSAEAINVTSISIQTNANTGSNVNGATAFKVQNLIAKVDGTTWNFNVPTVDPSFTYTFTSPSGPLNITAGGSKVVDVYADVLTGASTSAAYAPVNFTAAVANGASTNSNQTLSGAPVAGQQIIIVGSGSASASLVSGTPVKQQIPFNAQGVTVGAYTITASNNEDVRVDQVKVTLESVTPGAPSPFTNLQLVDNTGAVLATLGSLASTTGTTFTGTFTIPGEGVTIVKNQQKTLTVKANVSDYNFATEAANKTYRLMITNPSTDIRAFGKASNVVVTVSPGTALTSNDQKVVRTKATVALTPIAPTVGRVRTATDDVANLMFTVDTAFGIDVGTTTLTFSGAAISGSSTTISLVDANSNAVVASSTGVITSGSPISFAFNGGTGYRINQGEVKTFKVRVNSSSFANTANSSDGFSVQITGANDVRYVAAGDTLGVAANEINLVDTAVPMTATISYE